MRNQLHQQLLQLAPTYASRLRSLTTEVGLQAAASYARVQPTLVQQQRSAVIRRLVQRLHLTGAQGATLGARLACTLQRAISR